MAVDLAAPPSHSALRLIVHLRRQDRGGAADPKKPSPRRQQAFDDATWRALRAIVRALRRPISSTAVSPPSRVEWVVMSDSRQHARDAKRLLLNASSSGNGGDVAALSPGGAHATSSLEHIVIDAAHANVSAMRAFLLPRHSHGVVQSCMRDGWSSFSSVAAFMAGSPLYSVQETSHGVGGKLAARYAAADKYADASCKLGWSESGRNAGGFVFGTGAERQFASHILDVRSSRLRTADSASGQHALGSLREGRRLTTSSPAPIAASDTRGTPTLPRPHKDTAVPRKVAVIFTGELRLDGPAQEHVLRTQCQGSTVYVATYRPFADLALRLANGHASRVMFASNLRPDDNHVISLHEASKLRRDAGLPPLKLASAAEQPTPLRAKGVRNRDGSPSPSTTQQWAVLDIALLVFGPELLREKYSLIVRSRTDLAIGEPPPYGNLGFRYSALSLPLAGPNIVCASTDRVFYASGADFLRIFGSMWRDANLVYSRPPSEDHAAQLAQRVAAQLKLASSLQRFPKLEPLVRLGCNALGVAHNGVVYAWRKLPKAINTSKSAIRMGDHIFQTSKAVPVYSRPNWTAMPHDMLGFHSEQAFAYHVMVTSDAACHSCFFQGPKGHAKLLVNRSSCRAVPGTARNESTCSVSDKAGARSSDRRNETK